MAIVRNITVTDGVVLYAFILAYLQWWLVASVEAGVDLPEQLTYPGLVVVDLHW